MTSRLAELSAGHHPLREARDRRLRQAMAHYGLPPEQRPLSTSKPKPGYTQRGMPRLYKPGCDHAFSYSRQAYSNFQQLILAARHCVDTDTVPRGISGPGVPGCAFYLTRARICHLVMSFDVMS